MARDIVHDIILHIGEQLGEMLCPDELMEVERAIRRQWGGARTYVARCGEALHALRCERDDAIRRDHAAGMAVADIAARRGVSKRMVYCAIGHIGWLQRTARGERNAAIRQAYARGVPVKEIARRHGLSPSRVRHILGA